MVVWPEHSVTELHQGRGPFRAGGCGLLSLNTILLTMLARSSLNSGAAASPDNRELEWSTARGYQDGLGCCERGCHSIPTRYTARSA
jgi:hypothetical protein